MLTIKRLYLYGVLGVAMVLLLWGLTDLVRFALDGIHRAVGSNPALGGSFAGEELSRAVALVLVAGSIVAVHLALIRRSLRGAPAEVADERASASRSTYFFFLLAGTGSALVWALFGLTYALIVLVAFGDRGPDLIGPLGLAVVVGGAWLLHLLARAHDLRAAPERTAGDWLTRLYLYGGLFITIVIVAVETGDALTAVAREVLDLRPAWESTRWWPDAISGPIAATIAASVGWLTHWLLAGRLMHAPDPMGHAHRSARTRRAYFFVVVLTGAAAVLALVSMSGREAIALALGVPVGDESRAVEDIGGPLLMAASFAVAWWWHQRRVSREALAAGGSLAARSVGRSGRLLVSFVGLAGLAAGLAWELQVLIDSAGSGARASLISTSDFEIARIRGPGTRARRTRALDAGMGAATARPPAVGRRGGHGDFPACVPDARFCLVGGGAHGLTGLPGLAGHSPRDGRG